MKNQEFKSFLFRTAVIAMACDGDIAESEISLIKHLAQNDMNFLGLEFDKLLIEYVDEIKVNGKKSINSFLQTLNESKLNPQQEKKIIEVLLAVINADSNIEDSELSFLHLVLAKLNIDQETLIVDFPKNIEQLLGFQNYTIDSEFTDEVVI